MSVLSRLVNGVAGAALAVSFAGCASAPQAQANDGSTARTITIPDPARPQATKCDDPSLKGAGLTMVMAGIGHVLDKKTGGGRAFEKMAGQGTAAVVNNCVAVPEGAASAPPALATPQYLPR